MGNAGFDVSAVAVDAVGGVGALLMGPDGGFITGSDFLMDGGVTASFGSATSPKCAAANRKEPDMNRRAT